MEGQRNPETTQEDTVTFKTSHILSCLQGLDMDIEKGITVTEKRLLQLFAALCCVSSSPRGILFSL